MPPRFVSVIACGGQGRRLGADKPGQVLGGESLIERTLGTARRYGPDIALAVRGGRRFPEPIDRYPHIDDDEAIGGPIAALQSGFRYAQAHGFSHVLLLACDQPFLPSDLAERLSDAIDTSGVAVPVSGGHNQYMAALWQVRPRELGEYIAAGERSLWQFAQAVEMKPVTWPLENGQSLFSDIDDQDDLERAKLRIKME